MHYLEVKQTRAFVLLQHDVPSRQEAAAAECMHEAAAVRNPRAC
jgi:hypothetical protein